jgi:hypothetical protein
MMVISCDKFKKSRTPEEFQVCSPPIYWRVRKAAAKMQVLKGRMKMPGFKSGGCCGLTGGLKPAGFVNRTFGTGFLHHPPFSRPINWQATVGNPFGMKVSRFQGFKVPMVPKVPLKPWNPETLKP